MHDYLDKINLIYKANYNHNKITNTHCIICNSVALFIHGCLVHHTCSLGVPTFSTCYCFPAWCIKQRQKIKIYPTQFKCNVIITMRCWPLKLGHEQQYNIDQQIHINVRRSEPLNFSYIIKHRCEIQQIITIVGNFRNQNSVKGINIIELISVVFQTIQFNSPRKADSV